MSTERRYVTVSFVIEAPRLPRSNPPLDYLVHHGVKGAFGHVAGVVVSDVSLTYETEREHKAFNAHNHRVAVDPRTKHEDDER